MILLFNDFTGLPGFVGLQQDNKTADESEGEGEQTAQYINEGSGAVLLSLPGQPVFFGFLHGPVDPFVYC